jgi:uncharacterized protein (TIGR02246 family)
MFYLLDSQSTEPEKQMFTLPTPDTSRRTDPAAVASPILQQLEQAWNDADGAAFGAVFADEMDFVNVRGEHHRGDGAYIGRAHQGIFDSIYAGSTVSFRLDIARVLAPGVVLAVASSTLDVPQGPLQGIHHARMTMVIAAQDGDWRITAFHNTLVADAG